MSLKKLVKRLMIVLAVLLVIVGAACAYILSMPDFGRTPENAARIARINASDHFKDGVFVPLETTQTHLKDGFLVSMYKFLLDDRSRLKPKDALPVQKTELKGLDPAQDLIIWMGHSSFYMQLGGKRILVDPIFSGHASPFDFMVAAFPSTDVYTPEDMPEIDLLLISHDHWDHLDYTTVTALRDKVKTVMCGLGVGEHFEYWGYDPAKIVEKDWYDEPLMLDDLSVTITPARHFSGRFLKRNPTLPVSYVFKTPERSVFYSGDTAYGKHFADIAQRLGPFDFAVMEDGQYNEQWHNVHMMPEEMVDAATILGARAVLPVHNSKFILSEHRWDEPLNRVLDAASGKAMLLETPKIGQAVNLDTPEPTSRWWK